MQAVAPADIPAATEALQKYADLVRDVLLDLCGYKEFQHLEFLESSNSYNASTSQAAARQRLSLPHTSATTQGSARRCAADPASLLPSQRRPVTSHPP